MFKNDKTVWSKPFTIMPHQFKFALKASKEDILPEVCRSTNVNYLEDENEEQQEDIKKPTKWQITMQQRSLKLLLLTAGKNSNRIIPQ